MNSFYKQQNYPKSINVFSIILRSAKSCIVRSDFAIIHYCNKWHNQYDYKILQFDLWRQDLYSGSIKEKKLPLTYSI